MARHDDKQTKKNEKKKTWPAFALYGSQFGQAIEKSESSKPFDLACGLYIISTPIGNLGDITLRSLWALQKADAILCEDTRVSGKLLKLYGIQKPLISCHDYNESARTTNVLARLSQGQALALISDAGTPLIADPGYKLVRACREAGYDVFALPGASALLTALASAGLPTDRFLFVGFLPNKKTARRKEIETLTTVCATLVFYESPQRIAATLTDMSDIFGPTRHAVIARELTKLYEEMRSGTLEELTLYYKETTTPKGEIVLLIEPAENKPCVTNWQELLKKELQKTSLRDAVAIISQETNIKKSLVYQKALEITSIKPNT